MAFEGFSSDFLGEWAGAVLGEGEFEGAGWVLILECNPAHGFAGVDFYNRVEANLVLVAVDEGIDA